MKMEEVERLILEHNNSGFMVSFDWYGDGLLRRDWFPDKNAGEKLIETKEEANELAEKFALAMKGKVCNLYVMNRIFECIEDYVIIKNR